MGTFSTLACRHWSNEPRFIISATLITLQCGWVGVWHELIYGQCVIGASMMKKGQIVNLLEIRV